MKTGIIRWTENITNRRLPQCFRCVHHFGKRRCKAFPEKDIPREFLFEKVKHDLISENQVGDYIYVVKEKFKEEDKRNEFIGKQAISKLASNKKKLPIIIRKKIKESGGDLDLIEKLEIESSGPVRSRFDFKIEFFPKEQLVDFDVWRFRGEYIASKILTALEAKNLTPYFKLTIFKNGDYKYDYK